MRPNILSGSKVSERVNRAYSYYCRRTRTPHSVSCVEMAPKLTRLAPSPKTHSPMAQAAAGMYMTYHYQCRAPLLEECPQHHGHKGDPGVTPGTCGAIGERAQVILVWVRAPGRWECLPPTETRSHEGYT